MAETEPGAVGQRGEDSREGRQLVVAAHGWWAVPGSRRPGWQAVPWQIGAAAHLLELPMAGGTDATG